MKLKHPRAQAGKMPAARYGADGLRARPMPNNPCIAPKCSVLLPCKANCGQTIFAPGAMSLPRVQLLPVVVRQGLKSVNFLADNTVQGSHGLNCFLAWVGKVFAPVTNRVEGRCSPVPVFIVKNNLFHFLLGSRSGVLLPDAPRFRILGVRWTIGCQSQRPGWEVLIHC